jgi:23S rRNA pseudouridine2605 synthase
LKLNKNQNDKVYIAFNKPIGILSSMKGENSLKQYFENIKYTVFHIGRLDKETSGLLLMTNDGDFANKISHPKNKIPKTYIATVNSQLSQKMINDFKVGFTINDKTHDFAKFDYISLLKKTPRTTTLKIKIHSGKNRIIRRSFESKNIKVISLMRIEVANIKLGELKEGKFRYLNKNELKSFI